MKRASKYFLYAIGAVMLISIGGIAGYHANRQDVAVAADAEEVTETIAIVNLDEGIEENGELINYASILISTSESGYTTASLEEARTGITNGKYAAYVVVPATFSEKVISLNSTPQKATIQYEINEDLRQDVKESTMYKIFSLEKKLNNDLGYMYLSSILNEFHTAQDNAKTIIENDNEDLEVLLSISELDLVSSVDIGKLKTHEFDIENLNLTDNYELNKQLIALIQTKYNEYVALGEGDLAELKTEGDTVLDYTSLTGLLNSLGTFKDENGNYVYTAGQQNVTGQLEGYNTNLQNNKDSLKEYLSAINVNYKKEADAQIKEKTGLKAYKEDGTIEENKTLDAFLQSKKSLAETLSDNIQAEQLTRLDVLFSNGSISTTNTAASIKSGISTSLTDQLNNAASNMILQDDIALCNQVGQKLQMESHMTNFLMANYSSLDPVIQAELESAAISCEYSDFTSYYSSLASVNPSSGDIIREVTAEYKKVVNTTVDIDSSVSGSIDNALMTTIKDVIVTDVKACFAETDLTIYYTAVDSVIVENLDNILVDFTTQEASVGYLAFEEAIENLPTVDATTLGDTIANDIIEVMTQKSNAEMKRVAEAQTEKSEEISAFHQSIQTHNPLAYVNQSELGDINSDLLSNNQEIESSLNGKFTEYVEYAMKSNETANENVNSLVDKIYEANDASNQQVSDGLLTAKDSRIKTNETNIIMLSDFIEKLPYTKLGSGPSAAAYDFIVDPLNFTEESTYTMTPNRSGVVSGSGSSSEDGGLSEDNILLIILIIFIAVAVISILYKALAGRKRP